MQDPIVEENLQNILFYLAPSKEYSMCLFTLPWSIRIGCRKYVYKGNSADLLCDVFSVFRIFNARDQYIRLIIAMILIINNWDLSSGDFSLFM